MSTLFVVSTIFVLSLLGAVVMFKFFKSAAIVKTKSYQAGGAIAGFIIIYSVLYGSYANIEKNERKEMIKELKELKAKIEPKTISGTVDSLAGNAKIVLAVKEVDPDNRGKFRLRASCLDPEEDDIRLFVMTENGNFDWAIYSEEEMTGISISVSN